MAEVYRLCDTISVLRDGRHVATRPASELSEPDLVQLMIGRPVAAYFGNTRATAPTREELLRVEHLSSDGRFEDVSFSVHAGEVVGLAGLVGAGRSDVAETIFGARSRTGGIVTISGRPANVATPAQAIRLGIALVPEDRKRQGLVLSESGRRNTSLP